MQEAHSQKEREFLKVPLSPIPIESKSQVTVKTEENSSSKKKEKTNETNESFL